MVGEIAAERVSNVIKEASRQFAAPLEDEGGNSSIGNNNNNNNLWGRRVRRPPEEDGQSIVHF